MTQSGEFPPLSIQNLTFQYRIREHPAIDNLSFTLNAGELLLVAGASGCGKTTLMRCINGLIPRSYRGELKGSVALFGQDARKLSMAQLSQLVGTLLQDPERQVVGSFGPMRSLCRKTRSVAGRDPSPLTRRWIIWASAFADRETFLSARSKGSPGDRSGDAPAHLVAGRRSALTRRAGRLALPPSGR